MEDKMCRKGASMTVLPSPADEVADKMCKKGASLSVLPTPAREAAQKMRRKGISMTVLPEPAEASPSCVERAYRFGPRALTEEERRAAWRTSRFGSATAGHENPVALWIVGPSAVGKSTIAAKVAHTFGIPKSVQWSGDDAGAGLDAVVVDGAFFREAHATYQRWVNSPDWETAYPAMKKIINREKDEILAAAARERKDIIIPQTCLNLPVCLATMEMLQAAGYTNHVLAVVAPRDEVARRGRAREREDGKRYAPDEFDRSVEAVGPMIAASNGRFKVLRAVQPPPEARDDARRLLSVELASGYGGQEVRLQEDALLR